MEKFLDILTLERWKHLKLDNGSYRISKIPIRDISIMYEMMVPKYAMASPTTFVTYLTGVLEEFDIDKEVYANLDSNGRYKYVNTYGILIVYAAMKAAHDQFGELITRLKAELESIADG